MDALTLIYLFILGLLVGSFINVVSLRFNTGMSIVSGRSRCFSCGLHLHWYELVPVLSFFILGGRCRRCNSPISIQYPLVELLTGLLFVAVALRQYYYWPLYGGMEYGLVYSILFFIYYVFIFGLLFVIALYDSKHTVIPNSLVYTFIFLATAKLLVFMFYRDFALNIIDVFDLLAPILLSLPFALLWLFSKGKWIGLGDAKLVFGIGALLGFISGVSAVILGFWIGALWVIWLYIKSKMKKKHGPALHSELPLAPFLIMGTVIVFFSHLDLLNIEMFLTLFP